MVRLSFIMSIALAVQGIQAAPAVRNNNIERRDSVIQRAEKIPVSYPGGYEKRDNSRPSDNSVNKKDKPTLAAESTSSSGSDNGSTAPATKPSENSGSENGSTGPATEASKNSGSDKSSTALAAKSTNNCDRNGNTTPTPNGLDNSGSKGDGTLPQALPTSVPGANVNPKVPTRTPGEEKAVQDKLDKAEEQAARGQKEKA